MTTRTLVASLAVGMAIVSAAREVRVQTKKPFADATVQHVGLATRDIAKAVKDYAEFLGIPTPKLGEVKTLKYPDSYRGDHAAWAKIAMIGMGNILLDLVEPVGGVSPWRTHMDRAGEGLYHVCIEVDDVDAAVDDLVRRGGTHEMGVRGAVSQYVNMEDTLGITFELMQRGRMKAAGYDNLPTPTKFAAGTVEHAGVVVRDADKAGRLMADILGVAPPTAKLRKNLVYPKEFDAKAAPKIAYLQTTPIAIEFIEPTGGKSPWRDFLDKSGPSLHHLGVRVKNLQENIAYAQQHGGQVVVGPTQGTAVIDLKSRPLPFAFELIER